MSTTIGETNTFYRASKTEIFRPTIMPRFWERRYEGLRVERPRARSAQETLYGIRKGGRSERLQWRILLNAVEEHYGFKPQSWTEEEFGHDPELANEQIESSRLDAELNLRERAERQNRIRNVEAIHQTKGLVSQEDVRAEINYRDLSLQTEEGDDLLQAAPALETEPELLNNKSRGDRLRSRWNQTAGRIGNVVLGCQVKIQNNAYPTFNRSSEKKEIITEHEIKNGYSKSECRVGTAVLVGGIAVAGVLAVYLLNKNTGHNYTNGLHEFMRQNNLLPDQHIQTMDGLNNLHSTASQHSDTLNHIGNQVNDLEVSSGVSHASEAGTTSIHKGFVVERGSGIIKEIQEYAKGRGKNISDNTAYNMYRQIRSNFGRHIINLVNTKRDTYMVGSDIHLSQPGPAHWFVDAGRMLNKLVGRS